MNKFYSLILTSYLFACSSEPKVKEVKGRISDSIVERSQNKIDSSLVQVKQNKNDTLETSSNCSVEFLKEFNATKKSWVGELYIKSNKIYDKNGVIAEFPDYPKKGQTVTFTGNKDNLDVTLKLKRINYTTLEYTLELIESSKINYTDKGQVHLGGGFFLGAESFDNPKDPQSLIFADEYYDKNEGSNFSIKIGDIENVKTHYLQISDYYLGNINKKYKDNFPLLTE